MSRWPTSEETAEEEVLEQDYSPVWQGDDGVWNYRVSAISGCTSLLLAYRLGMSGSNATPEWLQERFDEGHAYELPILERARKRGFSALYGFQERTVQQVGSGARLLGHIDALGVGDFAADSIDGKKLEKGLRRFEYEGPILIDAKAFAQSTWDTWRRSGFAAFPYYAWQMSGYAKFFGDCPIAMAVGLKDREAYKATGETVLKDFRIDVFTKPPIAFGKIVTKILKIENLARKGMDGLPATCDIPTSPCPFFSLPFHTKAGKGLEIKDGQIVGGLEKLAELANVKHQAQVEAKKNQAVIDDVDMQMRELVGDVEGNANVAAYSDGVSSITFQHKGYQKVRWDEMVKKFPGLDPAEFKETAKSDKLSVVLNAKRSSPKPNTAGIVD